MTHPNTNCECGHESSRHIVEGYRPCISNLGKELPGGTYVMTSCPCPAFKPVAQEATKLTIHSPDTYPYTISGNCSKCNHGFEIEAVGRAQEAEKPVARKYKDGLATKYGSQAITSILVNFEIAVRGYHYSSLTQKTKDKHLDRARLEAAQAMMELNYPPLIVRDTEFPPQLDEEELDRVLTKAFNDFYDYITERDIVKAAHEYSEKTVYKKARAALLAWAKGSTKARREGDREKTN